MDLRDLGVCSLWFTGSSSHTIWVLFIFPVLHLFGFGFCFCFLFSFYFAAVLFAWVVR